MKLGVAFGNAATSGLSTYLALTQAFQQQDEFERRKAEREAYKNFDPTAPVGTETQTLPQPVVVNQDVAAQAEPLYASRTQAPQAFGSATTDMPAAIPTSVLQTPESNVVVPAKPVGTEPIAPRAIAPQKPNEIQVQTYTPAASKYRENAQLAADAPEKLLTYGTESSPSALLRQKAAMWEQGAIGSPAKEQLLKDAEKMRIEADRLEKDEATKIGKAMEVAYQKGDAQTLARIMNTNLNDGTDYDWKTAQFTKDGTFTVQTTDHATGETETVTVPKAQMQLVINTYAADPIKAQELARQEKATNAQIVDAANRYNLDVKKFGELVQQHGMDNAIRMAEIYSKQDTASLKLGMSGKPEKLTSSVGLSPSEQMSLKSMVDKKAQDGNLAKLNVDPDTYAAEVTRLMLNNPELKGDLVAASEAATRMYSDPKSKSYQLGMQIVKDKAGNSTPVYFMMQQVRMPNGKVYTADTPASFNAYMNMKYSGATDPKQMMDEVRTVSDITKASIQATPFAFPGLLTPEEMQTVATSNDRAAAAKLISGNYDKLVAAIPEMVKNERVKLQAASPSAPPEQVLTAAKDNVAATVEQRLFRGGVGTEGLGTALVENAMVEAPKAAIKQREANAAAKRVADKKAADAESARQFELRRQAREGTPEQRQRAEQQLAEQKLLEKKRKEAAGRRGAIEMRDWGNNAGKPGYIQR